MDTDKKHCHRRKHKHKKHKKHRRNKEMTETEDTEQEVEFDQVEYDNIDIIEEEITLSTDHQGSILDLEHCDGTLEVVEEQLVEIDDGMGIINMEEMVLENYGQEFEELVDVGGVDDENGEEGFQEDESESIDEEEQEQITVELKPKTEPEHQTAKRKVKDKDRKGKEEGDISSGEEAWLEALESGKLEEVDDELRKIRNPKLLTVRQRALMERKGEIQQEEIPKEELMALPTGYKETVMTEEALKKKALKSQKRREVAAQKREKEKKRTIDRLLQKRESKTSKLNSGNTSNSSSSAALSSLAAPVSCYSWRQKSDGNITFNVPDGMNFPLPIESKRPAIPVVLCGVAGCPNPKRYSCSRTHIPLCSLQCYKANLEKLMTEKGL